MINKDIRIVYAEDHKLLQKAMLLFLISRGYKNITAVENGQELIEMLKNDGHYDLIITDYDMPMVNGEEATRVIREELKNDIPIIGCTAMPEKWKGVDGFHLKGRNTPEDLIKEIRRVLQKAKEKQSKLNKNRMRVGKLHVL